MPERPFHSRPANRRRLLSAALACLVLAACSRPDPTLELSGRAMGTSYSVQIVGPLDQPGREALAGRIRDSIEGTEQLFSTWRSDSEISRFNDSSRTDWQPVSSVVCALIERSVRISALTEGAFDITIGPVVDAWGFGPGSDVTGAPDAETLEALMKSVGYGLLDTDCSQPAIRKRRPGVRLDLSAIAKGYAIDAVAGLLENAGRDRFLVEIGGELRGRGRNGRGEVWNVAIENPIDPALGPAGAVRLSDTAMATSGNYRNVVDLGGRRYSHTIDPRTGRPVGHALSAVTVLASSAADADAWATALMVLGPERGPGLAEHLDLAAGFFIRVDDELVVESTAAFRQALAAD